MSGYSFPSRNKFWSEVLKDYQGKEYRRRKKEAIAPMGIGAAETLIYLHNGGRNFIRPSFRLGSMIGVSTRIVDDILDGDGCTPVSDRSSFLDNYIASFKTGQVQSPVEHEIERVAYKSAMIIHEKIKQHNQETINDMVETLEKMKESVIQEDKSSLEGFTKYVEGAGGEHGVLLAESLEIFPDFDSSKEIKDFAYDLGYGVQVADDRFDNDIELNQEDLKKAYQSAIGKFNQHNGLLPQLILKSKHLYPTICKASKAIK